MIKIDEYYLVDHDKYNWILRYEKKYMDEGKEKTSRDHWFYANLKQCLKKYLERSMKPSEDVGQIMKAIDEVHAKIDNLQI